MQADLFKCSFCFESYDLGLHLPKVLIPCLHCLCLQCLKNICIHHSPQEQQCPTCSLSFMPTFNIPEAFPTNPSLLQLLQSQAKTKQGGDYTEIDCKQASSVKETDNDEESSQDYVRKKQKTEQEIDDELGKIQEFITSQFIGIKKNLLISQNIDDVHHQNEDSLAETTSRLKGIFAETEEVFKRVFKKNTSQEKPKPFQQIPQDNSLPSGNGDEHTKFKMEASSALKANLTDDEDCLLLRPKMVNKVIEMEEEVIQEEEKLPSKNDDNNQFPEIQEMKSQIMDMETESQLKLDFSEKEISEKTFTDLCSEEFWKGIERNKICHMEVNFSRSSLTDQQFIQFVQNILTQMQNLISLMINFAQTKISSPCLQVLSYQCMKNHKLKTFVVNCSQTSIGDGGFKSIDDGLGYSLQTLENLELIFDSTDIQGEEFMNSLFGMDQLKNLKLSFEDSRISSEMKFSMASCLSFLGNNLDSLNLNFNGIEIGDESLESFSNHALSQMERLKHLKLSLGATFISNDFLSDFFQSLSSLATHLETLELDLHSTELSDAVFKQFCEEVLSKMQNIENLKLNLRKTKITDASLENFTLPVNKLKFLSLDLSENKIHDSGLQIFKENNNFKSFKSIDFQVRQTEVTDKALQDFLAFLEKGYDTKVFPCLNEASPEYSSDGELKPKNEIKTNKASIMSRFEMERKVYAELKKELVLHYGSNRQDPSRMGTIEASIFINKLEPKAYDSILIKILKRVLCISQVEALKIEKWKKIIQTRIGSRLEGNSQELKEKYRKGHSKRKTEKKQKRKNIEMNQNHLSPENQQNSSRTERKQSSSNSRRKENHCPTQRRQTQSNTETKQKISSIERNQTQSSAEAKYHIGRKANDKNAERNKNQSDDNYSCEVSSKNNPMGNIMPSELVSSFGSLTRVFPYLQQLENASQT